MLTAAPDREESALDVCNFSWNSFRQEKEVDILIWKEVPRHWVTDDGNSGRGVGAQGTHRKGTLTSQKRKVHSLMMAQLVSDILGIFVVSLRSLPSERAPDRQRGRHPCGIPYKAGLGEKDLVNFGERGTRRKGSRVRTYAPGGKCKRNPSCCDGLLW